MLIQKKSSMNRNILKGIVLAGGKSLRFGTDKALAEINGELLIEKPVQLLKSLGIEPVIIANPARDYSFLHCRIENDVIPDKGPLGGIYTAACLFLRTSLLVLTCDMPYVHQTVLENLLNAYQHSSITLFDSGKDLFQPFPGIYPSSLKKNIEKSLKKDELSMQVFLKNTRSLKLIPLPSEPSFFINVNSHDDLKA